MKRRGFLLTGAVLMILLGVARGSGGAILLLRGPATDSGIRASPSSALFLGMLLLVIALGLVVVAIGVLRGSRRGWLGGAWLVIAFVLDGMLNGYVLYGRPGAGGTLANLAVAALILLCLYFGRGALDGRIPRAAGQDTRAPTRRRG